MNIALFTDVYLPDINGVATSTYILKNELQKHGHHVLVVTTKLPDNSDYKDTEYILRIPGIDVKKLYGYRFSAIYTYAGMKEIKEFEPDIIHIQTEFSIGIFGKIAAEALNVPVCYTYHTMWEDYTHYVTNTKVGQDALKQIISKLSKIYGDGCDTLIVPSKKTADIISTYGITNHMYVIPTGLELDKFSIKNINEDYVNKIRDDYHLKDQFTVIFLGRIAEEKNIKIIIDAVTKINDDHLTLLVVGGGPQLEALEAYHKKHSTCTHIYFTGAKTSDLVPSYYHASNLFISASMSETQGLTYIEAMASSLPVLAKKDANLTDVIIDDYNGHFFDNEEELIQLIKEYMSKDLSELSHNALEHSKQYSSENFYQSIIKAYEQAIYTKEYNYQVVSVIDQLDKTYKVTLRYGRHELSLILPKQVIERYELKEGQVLDRDNVDALKDQEQVRIAYNKALKYLTLKDYSYAKMSSKLLDKGSFDPIIIDIVMDELINRKLIDDRAFIANYFNNASTSTLGVNKIIDKLKKEGISPFLIDEYLESYSNEIEEEKAIALVKKLYNDHPDKPRVAFINSIKNKMFNKGFTSETIDRVINQFDFIIAREKTMMLLKKECDKVYHRYVSKYEGVELKLKIITFLVRKGYEYDDINEVLEEYNDFN